MASQADFQKAAQARKQDFICWMWLVLCLFAGIIAMVWLGSSNLQTGYIALGIAFAIALLPGLVTGAINNIWVRSGFFAVLFLLVIQAIKVIFVVFAFILTLGCMRCAGKKYKSLR